MSALISVIVPVYRTEKYLSRAIGSVLAQTYQDWELLLVDDGSPDNCGRICDEYALKDQRIRVIHKENGGVSSARNAALEIAAGEYVAFLDSDDFMSPLMLELLLQTARENDCDIVQCQYLDFSDNPPDLGDENKAPVKFLSRDEALEHLEEMNFIVMWNKLYKRYLFTDHLFCGKIHEELAIAFKLYFQAKKIALLERPLYGYFSNPESLCSSKIGLKRLFIIDAYEEQVRFFTEHGILSCRRKALANLATIAGTLLDHPRSRYEDYEEFFRNLKPRFEKICSDLKHEKELRPHLRLILQCSLGQLKLFYLLHKVKLIVRDSSRRLLKGRCC